MILIAFHEGRQPLVDRHMKLRRFLVGFDCDHGACIRWEGVCPPPFFLRVTNAKGFVVLKLDIVVESMRLMLKIIEIQSGLCTQIFCEIGCVGARYILVGLGFFYAALKHTVFGKALRCYVADGMCCVFAKIGTVGQSDNQAMPK